MSKKEYWKRWFKAAGIRALKTVAETALATIGTSALLSEVNWVLVASASALAGIITILSCLAGLPEVKEDCVEIKEDDDCNIGSGELYALIETEDKDAAESESEVGEEVGEDGVQE